MEKQSVIQDYESGRAIPNPQVISKLERALGCRLPREKKKKTKTTGDDLRTFLLLNENFIDYE